MRHLDGGVFKMGSQRFYPEEAPVRAVRVDPFWIDEAPVTNREFARFVAATGHRTLAEIAPDPADYPGMPIEMAQPGSLVFEPTARPVDLRDFSLWWRFAFGADWRHPLGPDSGIDDLADHPVVHIAYSDAEAYAAWAGKSLPSEAEWEYAARGGTGTARWWGDDIGNGNANCNGCGSIWDNHVLAPVDAFSSNPFGLSGMLGNAWEWTGDCWHPDYVGAPADGRIWAGGDCARHALRGGAWNNVPIFIRSASRSGASDKDYDYSSLAGFRVARDLP
jgi:formylglycine-generating enzyme required for sulfatase activity